ncbi:MAG: hypothetical protein KDM91_23210, partial [Verrucomicrobiae bacterium]|nr:hypothetical protein [Verrucomicrobiae bacterium]
MPFHSWREPLISGALSRLAFGAWTAAACFALAAGAHWISRRIERGKSSIETSPAPARCGTRSRGFLWALLAVTLTGAGLRIPAAHLRAPELDESEATALYVTGYEEPSSQFMRGSGPTRLIHGPAESLYRVPRQFHSITWFDTAFGNQTFNNHAGYSIFARATGAFVEIGNKTRLYPLRSARIPALAFGIACVPLLGFWTARHAGAKAGILAALLLAVNPMSIDLSTQARGYTFGLA